ncbi:MAG: hypothetical protein J5813_03295 [Candidatus Methanomethylophilaceae archaeon]|nr:hypothetical protein [Candidatus Methanomethylophilaceae archaeon]
MPDEFDPTVELGLPPDRYIVCTCRGFLTKNNDLRDLCGKFIENGEHVFDVIERYDRLTSYVLNREDSTSGSYYKWCVPFLKAYGATDHLIYKYSKEDLEMLGNAKRTMNYISNLLPTYLNTSTYEHGMLEVLDRIDSPLIQMSCTNLCIDQCMMGRAESRKLRDIAKEIGELKVPDKFYELNVPTELMDEDIQIIKKMDDIISNRIPDAGAMSLMESTDALTSHRKAYRMLDIRRLTAIDLDCTMYIGSSSTDFQPMDLIHEAGGLSVSYNGEDFAVRGATIAVLSEDTTVGAIFASMFTDKGPQAAIELAENWDRKYLKNTNFPDSNLMDTFLREHPGQLPEVYVLNNNNVDEIAKRSDEYRKALLGI